MKISMSKKKVRATELLIATRGAKVAILTIRRWLNKIRSSTNGKTGVEISIDRSANRENEINEARVNVEKLEDEVEKENERKRPIHALNEDELRNIANENLENELKELMSGINVDCDSDRRA